MLIALASGTALCGVVGWSVVRSESQAREREALAARRDAHELAISLRAALQNVAVLATVPTDARFIVRGGRVVVDDEVGWLTTEAEAAPDAFVEGGLRQAQQAEFVAHDPAAASARFDALLATLTAPRDAALPVLAAAAWQAQRSGASERTAKLIHQLDAAVAEHACVDLAMPRVADAVAATALLHAARGEPLPEPLTLRLAALPPALALPTFARLHERGLDPTAWRTRHATVATRRAQLLAIAHTLRTLPERATTFAREPHWVLWFPDATTPGAGQGARVLREWLTSLPGLGTTHASPPPGLPPLPARGRVQFTPDPEAEEVLADAAWVAPLPPPPPAWFARPQAIVGAGLVLVAVFVASAFAILRAARREGQAVRARADFLTGVTHELKTPVAAIRLVADVLHDDVVEPERQRQYFTLLAAETMRLSALVDNVLDLGQMERGERAYDPQPGDLAELVREVVAATTPLLRRGHLQLVLHEGAASVPARFDATALRQALLAVLENARKYASAGGRVELSTARGARAFTIAVRDHGPGVPAGEREAVFARFRRGSAHRAGTIPGVGLGLFLARSIVTHHGGTLVCTAPATGPGACFLFTLPLPESP